MHLGQPGLLGMLVETIGSRHMEYLQLTLIIYAMHTMVAQMDIFTLDDIAHVKIMSTMV